MALTMQRGKGQVLFEFLPGRTFDFERVATIARVTQVRGTPRMHVNPQLLLRRVAEAASAWAPAFRPALSDANLADPSRFVFLDPSEVRSELFPRVFWCQNRACGRVVDYTSNGSTPPNRCSACRGGRLAQVRWVKVHRCGQLDPLQPPRCPNCNSASHITLDTRRSERLSEFVWECARCHWRENVVSTIRNCSACMWPDPAQRRMRVDVHRAGSTFYSHRAVVVNVPHREYDALLSNGHWWALTAARFLEVAPFDTQLLKDLRREAATDPATQRANISSTALDDLLRRFHAGEIDAVTMAAQLAAAQAAGASAQEASDPVSIAARVADLTGVREEVWEESAQELLEYVAPQETGRPRGLADPAVPAEARTAASALGLATVDLIADYPILTAVYGFSREEDSPDQCHLRPFPSGRDHSGRFPIFVDEVQADALLLRLDPTRMLRWMAANGHPATLPRGTDRGLSERAYFAQIFSGVQLTHTLDANQAGARMVFGLLHTFSHLAIRHAALLCGLDRTSLSEYLLPRTLTAGIYCNHRFGATIGALTALFEQSLPEWFGQLANKRRCAYDPVCASSTGSCHACSHLAETSCRAFNLNLNRAFLFGGTDEKLGELPVGYFDPVLG